MRALVAWREGLSLTEGKIGVLSVSSLFLTQVGVYVCVCVCIRTHTHTLHRWGTWMYYCSERNNVVVLFGTLKMQSFILTEVSDCGLLIVVTSSTFLKRKDMLKEKSSLSKISSRILVYIYTCVLCTHIRIYVYQDLVHLDSSGPPGVSSRLLSEQ